MLILLRIRVQGYRGSAREHCLACDLLSFSLYEVLVAAIGYISESQFPCFGSLLSYQDNFVFLK